MSQTIACWMSEKKMQKLNWSEFERVAKENGFNLLKLDLNKSIESQANFCVFLHKLSDLIAAAIQGDTKNANLIEKIEGYLATHPNILVLDPIKNVRQILNRYISYRKISTANLHRYNVFTPNFCELKSDCCLENAKQLKNSNVSFPFICKPAIGHGSKKAHEMSIIFNEKGLKDCRMPCVAQSFINHDAILYKIYIVGEKHYVVERPSLKNFQNCSEENTIHFDSADISKAGCRNSLTVLEPHEKVRQVEQPNPEVLRKIAVSLREAFGMDLLGVDVVIENTTARYAIIDVNAFPGYDGFPNFFETLIDCIVKKHKHSEKII